MTIRVFFNKPPSSLARMLMGVGSVSALLAACADKPLESQFVSLSAGGTSNGVGGTSTGGMLEAVGGGLGGAAVELGSGGGGFVSEPIVPVVLTDNPIFGGPGTIVDVRGPHQNDAPTLGFQGCDRIARITNIRQRTTLGPGIQLSFGLIGPDGRALSSSAYAHCLELETTSQVESFRSIAPASNALSMVVVRPAETEEQTDLIRRAVLAFFLSRPAGERVALYRWGAELEQVSDFTNFFDSFSVQARDGLALRSDEEPLEPAQMIGLASHLIGEVVDDGPAWARSIVVVAPELSAANLVPASGDAQVVWATAAGTAPPSVLSVEARADDLELALGSASALVDEIRNQGFVTFGLCTDGLESEAVARSVEGGARVSLTLREALPEERVDSCAPETVASFEYYPTDLVEMHVSGETQEIHSTLILPESRTPEKSEETKDVALPVEFNMSSLHARSSAEVHLRGQSSFANCDSHRLSYAVNLEEGRERFFIPEEEGGIGTDKFILVAMCLDPTYLNQVSANALMADMELFSGAHRLVEFRINGKSQGVYLLIENPADTFLRSYSGVMSLVRRGSPNEVKFPEDEGSLEAEEALETFETVSNDWASLNGIARITEAETLIDLRRFLYYVAFNSLLENADWGDEPYFVGLSSLKGGHPVPSFRVYGWDNDDILKGGCDHTSTVVEDPFALIGCVENQMERALFGLDAADSSLVEDEMYAMYVDVLEQTMEHLSEARVGEAFERTASQLKGFAEDPDIVAAMPEWKDLEDVPLAIDAAVSEKKAAFALRRAEIAENLQRYRDSH